VKSVVLLAAFLSGLLASQRPEIPQVNVWYAFVADSVREQLRAAWSADANQVERAYCVTAAALYRGTPDSAAGHQLGEVIHLFVTGIKEARVLDAAPDRIRAVSCGPNAFAILHTHTPTTCIDGKCTYGGVGAFQCFPSRTDYLTMLLHRHKFGVVQCDANAFVFFYPWQYR
jgi:hypothetical protein